MIGVPYLTPSGYPFRKEIVFRQDGSLRLLYVDNADVQQIVNALS